MPDAKPIPKCHYCNAPVFANWTELALHISSSRKGHRKGKRWAANFLIGKKVKDKKKQQPRKRQTAEEKETKKNLVRVLSGDTEFVDTLCLRGKHTVRQSLPVEYSQNPRAWRIQGRLVLTCVGCGGK